MDEEPMNTNSLIPAMQSILNASDPKEVCGAVNKMNEYLAVVPVKQVLAQSGQFVDIVEQTLMDAIEDNQDLVLPHTKRECQTALNDWKILRRPVLPALVMTPAARTVLGIAADIHSLSEYEVDRQALWDQLQALEDEEQETVSGHLSQKLSELLICKMLPEVVRQKEDYPLLRQFRLWSQLMDCRKYGMEDLAVYFLQVKQKHYIRVLLPPAMGYHNDAQAYYTCARTFAILYYQIPVCQRDALFRSLYKALKDEVLHGVLDGEDSGALDAVQDLYLAMRTEKLTRQLHFWEAMCYTKHALDKNAKDDKEDN